MRRGEFELMGTFSIAISAAALDGSNPAEVAASVDTRAAHAIVSGREGRCRPEAATPENFDLAAATVNRKLTPVAELTI